MTVNELYRKGVGILKNSGVEDAEFDSRCLLEHAFNIDTTAFLMSRNVEADEKKSLFYNELLLKRVSGIPLQYIIGKWEFMGNEFFVGEGVLIPRPETEQLVELACDYLSEAANPVVVDFCSGSGCIAISIGKILKNAKVYAVEKYDAAFSYLSANIRLNNVDNVFPVKGDLFDKNVIRGIIPDLVLSNPPYIRRNDIKSLQSEVLHEPITALDGGDDGYDFYRFLSEYWLSQVLRKNTAMMVECAEDQGDYISELFASKARKTEIIRDFNGLQRIVAAYK